ncbi:MAG: ABC transporter permease [Myxococcota bacterium]
MNPIWTIFKREVSAYFNAPVAYVVVILFLLITGALFWGSYFQEINVLSLRSFFLQAPLFLTFFAPAVTMGLLASEKQSGTLELLMTMPVRDVHIVVGKFLAAVFLLCVVFLMTLPYPLTLSLLAGQFDTTLDWGATIAGYVGLLLLGSTYAAIGVMASSFTRDQVVAILLAFSISFFLYLIDQLVGQPTGAVAQAVEYLSTAYHFENIARGVIDLRDVVYYVSVIGVCLVTAQASISSRRW